MAHVPPVAGGGGGPPAGGGGAPVLPMPAPFLHSYVNYLNDASNDLYANLADGYTAPLAPFDIDTNNGNNNLQPAAVRNLILNAQKAVPLLLLHNNRVHVYLQPSRFEPQLHLGATNWDNNMYITKGDLHNNQAVTANWADQHFHQINATMATPTINTVVNTLAADNNLAAFGPYANNDPGTEAIRVRYACFCPAPYAAMLISTPLTPRTAWETVYAQVVADGREAQCGPLLKWLRMALVVNAQGNSVLEVAAPTAPLADNVLLDHRRAILERDFPLLNQAVPQLQQHQIATQLGQLVAQNQAHQAAKAAERAAARIKEPHTLFGRTGVEMLLRFLRLQDENQLPQIYRSLASASRHNRLAELQWALDAERIRLGFVRMSFIATPSLLQKIITGNWIMDHIDSITTGIQPYLFGDITPEESQQMSSLYQLVMTGTAAPSIDDAAALMAPSKPNLPKVLFQAREMLQRQQIFYNVFLQPNHDLSTNLSLFLNDFRDRESFLHHYRPVTPGYALCMPLLIIQWITLRINAWYHDQAMSPAPVAAPNFGQLFRLIDYREQWEPILHPALLQEYQFHHGDNRGGNIGGGAAPGQVQLPGHNAGGNGNRGGAGGGNDQNGNGNGGNGNGGNGGAGGVSPADQNVIPNQAIRNPNYKENLFGRFRNMGINHRQLRQAAHYTPPPASPHSNNNSEMCLSYHAKGICNLRCSRAYDHQPHNDDQDQELLTWMNANYHL